MRLDVYLTEHGYAPSRQRAKVLIEGGMVVVDGKTVTKPSQAVTDGEHTVTVTDDLPYVGRGGLKLEAALDAFAVSPNGLFALDIGASTGGFTDCLLQRGAKKVCAVDAGSGQLAEKLLHDARVTSLEHTNARELTLEQIGGSPADLIVMDVSFISATYILPRFPLLLKVDGQAICLIKPQFEVGKSMLGKGGIVKDPRAHRYAVERVIEAGVAAGMTPVGLIASPVTGGNGNREFLVYFINRDSDLCRVSDERITQVTGARGLTRREDLQC